MTRAVGERSFLGRRIVVTRTPLERCAVDAVVNSTDLMFSDSTNVSAALHRAAGPALKDACRAFLGGRAGDVRSTPGFALPAKHIVHVVGPDWVDGHRGEDADLARCVHSALEHAAAVGARSVALPPIGTGRRRFPVRRGCLITLATVRDFFGMSAQIERVTFSCVSESVFAVYAELAPVLFAAPAPVVLP